MDDLQAIHDTLLHDYTEAKAKRQTNEQRALTYALQTRYDTARTALSWGLRYNVPDAALGWLKHVWGVSNE